MSGSVASFRVLGVRVGSFDFGLYLGWGGESLVSGLGVRV